jgi:hypothetical protein
VSTEDNKTFYLFWRKKFCILEPGVHLPDHPKPELLDCVH